MEFNSILNKLKPLHPAGYVIDNIMNKDTKKENFENSTIYSLVSSLISLAMVVFAIYLSWRCNNKSFNIVGFLGAFCCSPCYIIYQFFNNGFCGMIKK
jgi:hypothetical protein